MDIRTVFWRLPADVIPPAGDTDAEILDIVARNPRGRIAEVLAADSGWEIASHTLAFDIEGPVLSMVFVRYPDVVDGL